MVRRTLQDLACPRQLISLFSVPLGIYLVLVLSIVNQLFGTSTITATTTAILLLKVY